MGNITCCPNLMTKSKGPETGNSSPMNTSSMLLIPKEKAVKAIFRNCN